MATEISDWNDLAAIPANATGTYIQQNTIDDTSAGYNTHGTDWGGISIGSGGEYNGNGYSIEEWETPESADVSGFFTTVAGHVHDLRLARVIGGHDASDPSRTGIFVGTVNSGGVVEKCHVETFARTTPNNFDAAGFVASNDGLIKDCIAEADVENQDRDAHGFGASGSGEYRRCVSAPVALNSQGFGSTYAFSGSGSATYTDCYYSTQTTSTDGSGATGVPQSDLEGSTATTTLSNYDFNTVWKEEFGDLPSLRDPAPPVTTIDLAATGSGIGTATNPVLESLVSFSATASGTGVASQPALESLVSFTANASGTGTAAQPVLAPRRGLTASGAGVGTGTASLAVVTPFVELSATGAGSGDGTATLEPFVSVALAATGAGTGTATDPTVGRVRGLSATAQGDGTATASIGRRRSLSASGVGAGTAEDAVLSRVLPLSASGAGSGDGSIQFLSLVRDERGVLSPTHNGVVRVLPRRYTELLSRENRVLDEDTLPD